MTMQCRRFAGRVALVTGSGRGIGKNIARAFAQAGATLAVCDIDEERGKQACDELKAVGYDAGFFPVDLGQKGAPRALLESVVAGLGRIDVIVNNARAGQRLAFEDETEDNWDLAMAVNLKSVFFLAQAAIPLMPAGGAIINISSVSARLVSRESASYQASKAGLLQLTRYLAKVAGPRGVRVNAVLPGFIVQDEHRARYEQNDNARYRELAGQLHPLGAPGRADDVANAAIFLASVEAAFITGQAFVVDGGLTIQDQSALLMSYAME
ncbi:MAG: SDR family oxidoreductase [Methylococcaceae bacterium]|nr:MAG: SDR family oxidoreductase [Methylococcaceae bacterium]